MVGSPDTMSAVIALGAVTLAWYAVVRASASGIVARTDDVDRAVVLVRQCRRWASVLGAGTAVAVALWLDLDALAAGIVLLWVDAAPNAAGLAVLGSVAGALALLAGPVLGVVLAVRLATLPHSRTLDGRERGHRRVARRLVSRYLAVVGVGGAATTMVLLAPSGWPRIATVAIVVAALGVAMPFFLVSLLGARRPTEAERARLSAAGLSTVIPVLVIEDGPSVGAAFAAGPVPGTRHVFVAGSLFANLEDEQLAAVIAHECAHHRRGHVGLRLALFGGIAVGLLAAVESAIPGTVAVGAPLAVVALAAGVRVVRGTEFAADAAAASRVGPLAMAGALERLAEREFLGRANGPLAGLLSAHPPIDERIDRLRALARSGERSRALEESG